MNLQDQDLVEAFRHRLEARFRRDRILKRCKIVFGVALASTLVVAVPFMLRTTVSESSLPSIEGPGKWYLSLPRQDTAE